MKKLLVILIRRLIRVLIKSDKRYYKTLILDKAYEPYPCFDNDPPEIDKPCITIKKSTQYSKENLASYLGYKRPRDIASQITIFNQDVPKKYKILERGSLNCHQIKMFLEHNDYRVKIV